jgi:hypothetical protein
MVTGHCRRRGCVEPGHVYISLGEAWLPSCTAGFADIEEICWDACNEARLAQPARFGQSC